MKLFGSIYIGSSEVILKIFEINRNSGLKEIDCLRKPIDVMKDIYGKNIVSLETTDKLINILNDMKKTIDLYKCDAYRTYAGFTLSMAENKLFVLEQIRLRTHMEVTSLSNSEHRFISFEAVASLPKFNDMIEESAVVVDVGGAGLQITLFSNSKVITTQHVKIGTYYTWDSLKKLNTETDNLEQISALIAKEMDTFKHMYIKDNDPKYMIIIGDRLTKRMQSDLDIEDQLTKTDKFIKYVKSQMKKAKNTVGDSGDDWAESFALTEPLLLLHLEIAKSMDTEYVMLPGLSINEGIAFDFAYREKWLKPIHDFDYDILSASWSIAKRYSSYEPHLKALEQISMQIFDTTKKYHNMSKRQKLLMRVVCILHDCGKYISQSEAADCSYTIIKSSEILGLTHKEREMVATIAAFNRKTLLPYDELADIFTAEEYWTMVQLLAILKVANAMDRSHQQRFKNISMQVKEKQLIISIEASASISLEKGMFKEKADFFENIFAIRPVIREKKVLK